MQVDIQGEREVIARLDAMADNKALVKALRYGVRRGMKPVLTITKARTPYKTGRLRASMGIVTETDRLAGSVSALVGPRRDFRYKDASGLRRAIVTSEKRRAKAQARGDIIDNLPAAAYAYAIETGRFEEVPLRRTGVARRGNRLVPRSNSDLARRAGGAHMMRDGLNAGRDMARAGVYAAILIHLQKQAAKAAGGQ